MARCKECNGEIVQHTRGAPKKYCSDHCRKTRWDRENAWKYKDVCPNCGGLKMIVSNFCQKCMGANNPEGINGR